MWFISSRNPPKCGATKKSAWMLVGAPIAPEFEKAPDAPHGREIAAVLHDGVPPVGSTRRRR